MDSSTWIAIYLPLYVIFFIIIPQRRKMEKAVILRIRKRKEETAMTNELIKKYIGKECKISTGSFGTNVEGKILDVIENWLEVDTRKGKELINAEFIQNIKIKEI
ncbi:MAG TPA: hypothetical protein VEG39_20950 [Clostridia bacterium]|nr:hypothetical protein [Clostridia bacterium]